MQAEVLCQKTLINLWKTRDLPKDTQLIDDRIWDLLTFPLAPPLHLSCMIRGYRCKINHFSRLIYSYGCPVKPISANEMLGEFCLEAYEKHFVPDTEILYGMSSLIVLSSYFWTVLTEHMILWTAAAIL